MFSCKGELIRRSLGVTVREVSQHVTGNEKEKQKGVDFTVFIRMMTLTRGQLQPHHIVLLASDTDYVPAIKLINEQGVHVIVVGFKKQPPQLNEALINESYLSLDLGELLEEMEKRQQGGSSRGKTGVDGSCAT
jgi:uncharacterized LabA/DUF88 family protein